MDPSLRRYLATLAAAGVRWVPRGRPARAGRAGPAEAPPAGDRDAASVRARPARGEAPAGSTAAAAGTPTAAAATAPGDAATAAPAPATPATPAADEPGGAGDWMDSVTAPRRAPRPADPAAALASVAEEVLACTACKLCKGRNQAVPGEGHSDARVLFVGEGPGAEEDRTGRPFVGPAGQLLDDIITKGMGLARADVFIANVVKCRPPANRVPEPDEVAACRGFLRRQIAAVAPAVICTLGATATRALLDTDQSMGRLRGRRHDLDGVPVIPTYHPAYLLRNPSAKRPTWQDIQQVMEVAGLR